ncbi:hypothetical protein CH339_08290 [Rhodobium orientis]|uniref:SurA N-terminal domain-containing protein n=2 Tax=Rhodobium orientis TaxID=34017 RepID=A0A327JQP5_9HYPH|nr:hypothetical protein [Rhodobium orientis]RAI27896.1 hypothetical protein CH339_08290 [Rhodobium orientis]
MSIFGGTEPMTTRFPGIRSLGTVTIAAMVLASVAVFAGPIAAVAQSTIRVIVNDTVITSHQIEQRARLLRLITRKSLGTARALAREELIDEALQLQEAKRRGYDVDDERVEAAYASIGRGVKLSPKQLTAALRRSGITPKTLKTRLKAQIGWGQLVQGRARSAVNIPEQEIISALKEKKPDEVREITYEYDLYQVIYVVPSNASNGFKAQQQRAANSTRASFRSCSSDLAGLRGKKDIVVKRIGIRLESDIRGEQRERLNETDVGRLSKPQEIGSGYEMIAVCDRKELKSNAAERSLIEDKLKDEESDLLARRYIRELRNNAVIIEK